jgi:hypothetical protein
LKVVSRIREKQNRLGKWLGFQADRFNPKTQNIAGPNTIATGGVRYATFRLFDNTRVVAKARAPGTGPAAVARNPVGDVRISVARFHEKIPLQYEDLSNLSPIIGPNATIDPGGQNYVEQQISYIAQQFNNAVEIMAAGMMQNNLYFVQYGDDWVPQLGQPSSGVFFQVPFNIPSGNTGQGNFLGTGNTISGSWKNNSTPIFQNISAIKAAFAQLTGYPVRHVWINSLMWYNVVSNSEIRNLAGSANTPFAEYDFVPETGYDGMQISDYSAILRCDPTIIWHITDDVLVTGNTDTDPTWSTAPAAATLQKEVPDTIAIFTTDVSPMWTQLCYGGEYVVENPGMPGVLRQGYYFWREFTTQPSGVDLIGLLNCVPLLYIPKIIAPLTVVFGS